MSLHDAYKFAHTGELSLHNMGLNGVFVDVPYLRRQYDDLLPQKIKYYEERLLEYEEVKKWRKKAGRDWSPDSDKQLQQLLYDQMGYTPPDGKRSVTRETMEKLKVPFAEELANWKKFSLCRNTYVTNLLNEEVDGIVNADINNLHPITYRSSCSSPNLHNQPKRDAFISRIMRRAFIPSAGFQFTDYDFKGMEVSISCCYHEDPNLIRDVEDPDRDMHWDSINDCFILNLSIEDFDDTAMAKKFRYHGKNKFTFPEFYGRWWKDCAEDLWSVVDDLILPDGRTVRQHLKRKGIRGLGQITYDFDDKPIPEEGSFYEHIMKVEDKFWNQRYPVYKKWRQRWWKKFKKTATFQHLTGFIEHSLLSRNDCINHPIQGTAFHILVRTAIEVDALLQDDDSAFPVLQVHDSEMIDHHPDVAKDVDNMMLGIVRETIPHEWDWVNTTLVIEAERSEVNGNWYDVKEVELA